MSSMGAAGVGLVLLFSAVAKALAPRAFAAHLRRLVGVPPWPALLLAVAGVAGEAALAVLLLFPRASSGVAAIVLVLLSLFTGATLWGWRRGRIEECGCYGAVVRLSPPVSAGINLVLIALLAARLAAAGPAEGALGAGAFALAAGAGVMTAGLALLVLLLPARVTPLVVGRRWSVSRLAREVPLPAEGTHVVAFLKHGCRLCLAWAKALRRLSAMPGFPPTTIVVPGRIETAGMPAETPSFTVIASGSLALAMLVPVVPMAALVRDGIVVEVYHDALPTDWVARLSDDRARAQSVGAARPGGAGTI